MATTMFTADQERGDPREDAGEDGDAAGELDDRRDRGEKRRERGCHVRGPRERMLDLRESVHYERRTSTSRMAKSARSLRVVFMR